MFILQWFRKYYFKTSFCQASKWHPTKTGSKTVNPFTITLQHEQTTEIKSSKLEITKEGVSIYYLKDITCMNININIYIFIFFRGVWTKFVYCFLKEKRWNLVRWYGWANEQPSRKCKDSEQHPQSCFVRTKHRNRRTCYSHKPVHL